MNCNYNKIFVKIYYDFIIIIIHHISIISIFISTLIVYYFNFFNIILTLQFMLESLNYLKYKNKTNFNEFNWRLRQNKDTD